MVGGVGRELMTSQLARRWAWAVMAGLVIGAAAPRPVVAQAVSFSKQVAPLLAAKCGGCHISGRRGGFQFTSYDALMKSGMVQKGQGHSSRIVEVIETGDMPRGGGKVSKDDLAMLASWIDAGAAFDGTNPTAAFAGVPAANAGMRPAPKEKKAEPLRDGEVSFAFDVAPILLDNCVRCHGADDGQENLRLATLQGMLRGGDSGPAIVEGKAGDSLLVKKLLGKGIDGQRMPRGKPPLADKDIATISKWIDQGAKLDLLSWTSHLDDVAAAGRARSLSDAELKPVRAKAGEVLWRMAIPDDEALVASRDRVHVIGNLPASRMEQTADLAAKAEAAVQKELAGADGRLRKGGLVLYVFRKSYDYSALWQQTLGGERPKGITGHGGMMGDVVYGAALLPTASSDDSDVELLLAEQLAAGAVAGRGLPGWFVKGAARAVAMRAVPKARLVKDWKRETPEAVRTIGSTADFFSVHADPAPLTLAAAGFVAAIATPSAKLRQFLVLVDGGQDFDTAFANVFRNKPQPLFDAWAQKEAKKK